MPGGVGNGMGVAVAVGAGVSVIVGVIEGCSVGEGVGVFVAVGVGDGVTVSVGVSVTVGVFVQVGGMGNGVAVWVGGRMTVVLANRFVVGWGGAAAMPAFPCSPCLASPSVTFNTITIKKNSIKTTPARAMVSKLERGELSFIIESGA